MRGSYYSTTKTVDHGLVPEAFLGNYNGYLQTDGYKAYDGLAYIKNLECMAHARRKFTDARGFKGKEEQVKQMLC